MLPFREGLGKDINYLVISRNILQLLRSSLNPVSDEVVPNLDVLHQVKQGDEKGKMANEVEMEAKGDQLTYILRR